MSTNNDFVSLAVSNVPGIGAPSDISDMAFGLSLIVEGPPSSTGEIVIEASEDGLSFAPATAVFPLNNPPAKLLKIVAKFARVVRFSGSGPAVVVLASAKTGLNLFGALSLSPLDTSEMGPLKTVVVVGQYVAPIVIEGSGDGTNYDAVASFNTQDADVISIEGTWATMRVRPGTVLTGVTVALGSGFVPGAGGTGGAVTQIIAGTNVTISPPSGLGAVTVNATGGGSTPDHLEESLTLNDSALTKYLVVRMNGDSQFHISRADSFLNCVGTIGVLTVDAPVVASYKIATNGQQRVAMEGGLTPVAGDEIWLSPNVFGRSTNIMPTTPGDFVVRLGTIKDTSAYISDGYVTADLNIGGPVDAGSGGSGITAVNSGDSGIVTKTVGTVVTVSQQVGAEWQFGRVYAVDGDLGDDTHLGYADLTAATTGAYAIACAAAGVVAKKTLAGLEAIFPRVGNGRIAVILIKQETYADSLDFLDGVVGYANGCPLVRGTVTDATAGSIAFAGDINDAIMAGCRTVSGLNASGYNPTGVPTTNVIPCVLNGGGAPGLPNDPLEPVGWRMRFSNSAPTQVALRNQCVQITQTTTNDTLHTEFDLPAAPVSTDVFFLEQGGVVVPPVDLNLPPSSRTGLQLVGIVTTGAFNFFNGSMTAAMCGSGNGISSFYSIFSTSHEYTDPFLGTVNTGGGFRSDHARSIFIECMTFLDALVSIQGVQIYNPNAINLGRGCVAGGLEVHGAMLSATTQGALPPDIGTTGTLVGAPRVVGTNLILDGVSLTIGDLSITESAQSCIFPFGKNTLVFVGQVSGSAGNTRFGLDLTQCVHTDLIFLNSMSTVVGSLGQIRFANGALGIWTNIQFEEAYDQAGNRLFLYESFGAEYNASMSPSVMAGVHVNPLGADPAYTLMRGAGASGQVTPAMADTFAHASGLVGKLLAAAEDGAACLYGGITGYSVLVFDAAPVLDAIAYLSVSTPGLATTTVPPAIGTNQKLRLGVVIGNAFPGSLALVRMTPEILPVTADGLP